VIRYLLIRVVILLLTLLVVSVIVFGLTRLQGDPRALFLSEYDTLVDKSLWNEWGRKYGLDKPVTVQYLIWLGKVTRGDFGDSFRQQRPVLDVVAEKIPNTLQLGLAAFAFSMVVSVPLGVLSAVRKGTVWDYAGRSLALLGQGLPPFWLGLVLILVFAVKLGWLPTSQKGGPDHFILPVITLGTLSLAGNLRLVRSSMLEILDSEFVKLARAKGVSRVTVVWKHAFRNALIAPLTHAGLLLVGLLTGSVVTETVFAWPGIGRLAVTSVTQNDYPVVSGVILIFTVLYVAAALVMDLLYAIIDPRIRLRGDS